MTRDKFPFGRRRQTPVSDEVVPGVGTLRLIRAFTKLKTLEKRLAVIEYAEELATEFVLTKQV
jgi:hypothetical protein